MNGLSNATPINYSYWTWTRQHKTEKLSETVLQDVSKKKKNGCNSYSIIIDVWETAGRSVLWGKQVYGKLCIRQIWRG